MRVLVGWAICLCAVGAFGGERWAVPVLGYVFDEKSKSIHPVTGVPGAAVLDRAIAIPVKVDRAAVAWGVQPWAVVAEADGERSIAVTWSESGVTLAELAGAIPWTDAAWGHEGAVALFHRSTGQVQVWKGIATAPEVVLQFDVPGVTAVALAQDGAVAAAAAEEIQISRAGSTNRVRLRGIRALVWSAGESVLLAGTDEGVFAVREGETQLRSAGRIESLSPDGAIAVECVEGRLATRMEIGPSCAGALRWLRSDLFSTRTPEGDLWLTGGGASVLLAGGGAR